jgi:hypothetical protein
MMNCGHAHADALAVHVVAGGRPALVDAGTYTYPGPERQEFRHSRAHNTVTVDGESSSTPAGPFTWGHVAESRLRAWESHPTADFFEGEHDGYRRLADAATHRRAVLFVKGGYWVVRDRLEAAGRHELAARWHCAPGLTAHPAGPDVVDLRGADGPVLRIAAFGEGRLEVGEGWVSRAYGTREASAVLSYTQSGIGAQDVITFLLPSAEADTLAAVRRVDARGGLAFAVGRPGGDDLLLLGDGSRIDADAVETDAELAWVRRAHDGGVGECLVVRGSYLRVGGQDVLRAPGRAPWLFAERSASERRSAAGAHSER